MVVVDKLTKMVHLTATHTTATAPSTAELYFNNISRLHGLQSSIVSDRDSKFTSRFWEALMELFGTKLKRSTAYHPQTDGQTERTNRTLEEMLRAYVSDRHDDWDTRLAPAEFAINNAVNSSTKQTPFYLNYGYHPLTPATLGVHRLHGSTNQVATEFYQRMQTDLEAARQQLAAAQQRQAHYANLKRQDAAFDVGDRVLLSTANLRLRSDGPASKFNVKWTGPFTILERVGAVAYRLDLPATMKIHPVFHISLLKPYFHDETTPERQETQLRPPPIINDDVYLVYRLLRKRTITEGGRQLAQYLVLWQGYPLSEATWEPAKHLLGSDVRKMKQELDQTKPAPAASTTAQRTADNKDTHMTSPTSTQHEQPARTPAARTSTRQRRTPAWRRGYDV